MAAAPLRAQPPVEGRTWTNPIDIDYRYNFEQKNQGISYRSGADPVIVPHKGEYYLFETIGGGYWRSADLVRWRHVTPSRWPFEDVVAPAALSVGDTIILMQSAVEPRPLLSTTEPATGKLGWYNRMLPVLPYAVYNGSDRHAPRVHPDSIQPGPWDPGLFRDDDGRTFLYWGSSNVYPLYGIELDPKRQLAYKLGERPRHLFGLEPETHGWERFGQDHRDTIRPFMEGAWMIKHGGRYYLQYAAPGTEYNVYATGTYVGSAPLGPFTYAPYNPVAYKPGGFATGAGHGNSFADHAGNWWTTGTCWVAVNWNFERRIVLLPAAFNGDGEYHASSRFADFPQRVPNGKVADPDSLFTGWMLLSYRKPATASSTRDTFPAARVTDENPRTFWVAGASRPGEWLAVDLGAPAEVRAVQVNYTDYRSNLYGPDTDSSVVYTTFRLSASLDGKRWERVADLTGLPRRDRPNAYVELARPVRARFVRYEHDHVGAPNLAVSDLRVFGRGGGRAPATPRGVRGERAADERDATVRWRAVPGATGYNVRWGIAPGKLYQTYQLFADRGTTLELRALNAGVDYWVAVEAFGPGGVSRLSGAVPLEARGAPGR